MAASTTQAAAIALSSFKRYKVCAECAMRYTSFMSQIRHSTDWAKMGKWIGVDLDGTLAVYHGYMDGCIGEPIRPMLERVRELIDSGREVRIFTARASGTNQLQLVRNWLVIQGLGGLAITNVKDFDMVALYDDKAMRVKRNTGYVCPGCYRMKHFGA